MAGVFDSGFHGVLQIRADRLRELVLAHFRNDARFACPDPNWLEDFARHPGGGFDLFQLPPIGGQPIRHLTEPQVADQILRHRLNFDHPPLLGSLIFSMALTGLRVRSGADPEPIAIAYELGNLPAPAPADFAGFAASHLRASQTSFEWMLGVSGEAMQSIIDELAEQMNHSATAHFTSAGQVSLTLDDVAATWGDPFVITGSGFVVVAGDHTDIDFTLRGRFRVLNNNLHVDLAVETDADWLEELVRHAGQLVSNSAPYVITSITPINACPGAEVTILGSNFGTLPGLVSFPFSFFAPGGTLVPANFWSDTEVRATVPAGAGSGLLELSIPESTIRVCGKMIGVGRQGSGNQAFLGGKGAFQYFTVAGRPGGHFCADPGSQVSIEWNRAGAGAGTQGSLRITQGQRTLHQQALDPAGRFLFRLPPAAGPVAPVIITGRAWNACGEDERSFEIELDVVPTLTIEGMEVTQGIQRFWREGVDWNSLPTVESNDTIVRVYVSCQRQGFLRDTLDDLTGVLRVGGMELSPINGQRPRNGFPHPFITARPRAEIDRDETDHTLNFRIPAALAVGTQTLELEVFGPRVCGVIPNAAAALSWTWQPVAALPIRFVRIFKLAQGEASAPSEAEALFTCLRALELIPSPALDIAPARVTTFGTDRSIARGRSGVGDLLGDLDDEHDCSAWESFWPFADCPPEDHARWVGLVPSGALSACITNVGDNTLICQVYDPDQEQFSTSVVRRATAHELGHDLGFRHVNAGCLAAEDFDPHPNNGELEDVPFDPFWNEAIPGTVRDLMSCRGILWTSEHTWLRMIAAL